MNGYYRDLTGLEACYGCGVCAAVCPVGIIRFGPDREGFYRPSVTEGEKCIRCGLCNGSCAALSEDIPGEDPETEAFAGYSLDPEVRESCSSGGIGYELARECVNAGGVFCGAGYDPASRKTAHYAARSEAGIAPSKGSKYMQSDSAAGFRQALSSPGGGNVIVGMPCQIASLRKYLNARDKNGDFTLVDFFCHGTPSLLLWQRYVRDNESTLGQADEAGFRNKKHGWKDSWRIWGRSDGVEVYLSRHEDLFYKYYLRNYVNNLPCYACPFRGVRSAADLRLGDMWGGAYGNDDKGFTSVLALTPKGRESIGTLTGAVSVPEEVGSAIRCQIRGDQPIPTPRRKLLAELAGERTLAGIYGRYRWRLWFWRLRFRIGRRWRRLPDRI